MTLTVTTKLAAMKMPVVVEKDGQRYSLDIADDEQGVDLVVERKDDAASERGGETPPPRKGASSWGGAVSAAQMILLAAMFFATSAFADRTANQGWVRDNFVSRTNEWKLAERRHALFVIDLNAENGGTWRSFELKASTNNFEHVDGEEPTLCFWGCSDEADGYSDAVVPVSARRGQDRMRLYWLTTRLGGDGRTWTKIPTTLDVTDVNPKRLAVLVSPELCRDGGWLGEENEEVVWCYTRGDPAGLEKDTNGEVLWHPIQPVRWFRSLPEWAK